VSKRGWRNRERERGGDRGKMERGGGEIGKERERRWRDRGEREI
jgi:hypothetical protein